MEPRQTRDLEIGQTLADIFRTYGANAAPFVLITLLAWIPSLISSPRMIELSTSGSLSGVGEIFLWSGLIGLFQVQASGLISFGSYRAIRRQPAAAADYLDLFRRRWWAILALGLLKGAIIVGGMFLLCVPGLLAMVVLYVAIPATMIESIGPIASMQRSWDLTEGYRWKIFGIILLVGILGGIVQVPFQILQVGLGQSVGLQVVATLVGALMLPVYASAAGLVYYRLRSIKEYVDADDIADVFS